jgi:cell wall-associated NlpC family hydrolase
MRGDILFYRPTDLISRVIARATHGPYAHCAVDLGDGTKIEALTRGVARTPGTAADAVFSLHTDPDRLERAVTWLEQQVGNRYGWEDIANQVLRAFRFPFYFGQRRHYDCSDLCARFARMAGGIDLGPFREDLHLITPNDLARCAGLLK